MGNVQVFVSVLAEIASGAAAGALNWAAIDSGVRMSVLSNSAEIAQLVLDAASPFVTSDDVTTSVGALNAVMSALIVFANVEVASRATEALDDSTVASPLPSFLPQVHATWPFFVSAITSGHDVACRRAFEHISHVAKLSGGDFLRDRVKSDLWPYMQRQLRPDADAGVRIRVSILHFIRDVASDEKSRDAFRSVAMPMADAVSQLLARDAPLSGRQVFDESDIALGALESLSCLDGDGVHLLLWRLGRVQFPRPPDVRSSYAREPLFMAV